MRYGKFVAREKMSFSNEEISKIANYFSTIVNKYAQEPYSIMVMQKGDSVVVKFYLTVARTFRNRRGARIIGYKGFEFTLYKQKGYLDNWDWCKDEKIDPTKEIKDYASAPEYQYSCYLAITGKEIPYRGRNEITITPKGNTFEFGTELTDLDFTKVVKEICEVISVAICD